MVRTRVGYAGGSKENPTYYQLGDHTETVQVDYDPGRITYEELLDVFWQAHNPTFPQKGRQYMSVVFYHSPEQQRLALESKEREEVRRGRQVVTEIAPLETFYLAEAYHQKYYLRQMPTLSRAFEAIYPDLQAFVDSTAAARVNGYLGGHGSPDQLDGGIDALGLPADARAELLSRIGAE